MEAKTKADKGYIVNNIANVQTVNILFRRCGRFTIAQATTASKFPKMSDLVFQTSGAASKETDDKDSPELGYLLAAARSLRVMAREMEDTAMDEVHKRCAFKNPLKNLSLTTLERTLDFIADEVDERYYDEAIRETVREEAIKAASLIPREEILAKRELKKTARKIKSTCKTK